MLIRVLWGVFAALVIAGAVYLAASTPSYVKCENEQSDSSGSKEKKEGDYLARLYTVAKCVAVSTEENNGFVTAVATVLLAIITYQLVVGGADTTRRQLRAYPGIVGARIDLFEDRVLIEFFLENHTKTPAYQVRYGMAHQFVNPARANTVAIAFNQGEARWDMAYRSRTTLRREGTVKDGQFSSLASGDLVLVVVGRVNYRDAFRRKRHIAFRYRDTGFTPVFFEANGSVFLDYFACPEPEAIEYESN